MIKNGKILIVDDNETNRNVLNEMILSMGHTPSQAENGRAAIELIKSDEPPHIVLLDILMPEMDGYEVLKFMKAEKSLETIPVIMITAIDEVKSAADCIEKGAEDYLIKPFNPTLLKARISNCLEKKSLRDKDRYYINQLENINIDLGKKVIYKHEVARDALIRLQDFNSVKSEFLGIISHELRTPLNGLFGSAEILFNDCKELENDADFRGIFIDASNNLLKIVEHALLLTNIGLDGNKYKLIPCALDKSINSASGRVAKLAANRGVTINLPDKLNKTVSADFELLEEAFESMLFIMIKLAKPDSSIDLSFKHQGGEIKVEVKSDGYSIPEKNLKSFFEIFSIRSSVFPNANLGLRPSVVERIIDLFGGSVKIENQTPPGAMITVKLKTGGANYF